MRPFVRSQLKLAESARTLRYIEPAAESTLEDVLKKEAWAHIAHELKEWDRIEVLPVDRAYYAELFVSRITRDGAQFLVAKYVELSPPVPLAAETTAFDVAWAGRYHAWRVVRKSDGVVMRHGFQTQAEAARWLNENVREIA